MNSHQQILLNCLRNNPLNNNQADLQDLTIRDWHEIINAAKSHGVASLLYATIQKKNIALPDAVTRELLVELQNNTARNLKLMAAFQVVVHALQTQNIPLIPLKGIYLAATLYGNIGERVIGDIDILLPFDSMEQAVTEIETHTGYHPYRAYDLKTELKNLHHLPAYIKADSPPLEIHWTLLAPRFENQLDVKNIWERAIPAKLNGIDILTLNPNDLIIYLCAHAAYQHMFINSLRNLYDIKCALEHFAGQLDWEVVRKRAMDWSLLNSTYLALRLTDHMFTCSLPDRIWLSLRPENFNETLLQAAQNRVFEQVEISPTVTAIWMRGSFLGRLKGSLQRITVPPEVLAGMYKLPPKSKKVYFYYFVRAKDLLLQYGYNVLTLLTGSKIEKERAVQDSQLVHYLNWWEEK